MYIYTLKLRFVKTDKTNQQPTINSSRRWGIIQRKEKTLQKEKVPDEEAKVARLLAALFSFLRILQKWVTFKEKQESEFP